MTEKEDKDARRKRRGEKEAKVWTKTVESTEGV